MTDLLNSIQKEALELNSLSYTRRIGKTKQIAASMSRMLEQLRDAYEALILELNMVVEKRTRFLECDEKAKDASAIGTSHLIVLHCWLLLVVS